MWLNLSFHVVVCPSSDKLERCVKRQERQNRRYGLLAFLLAFSFSVVAGAALEGDGVGRGERELRVLNDIQSAQRCFCIMLKVLYTRNQDLTSFRMRQNNPLSRECIQNQKAPLALGKTGEVAGKHNPDVACSAPAACPVFERCQTTHKLTR